MQVVTPKFRLESPRHPEQIELLRAELAERGWAETQGDDWSLFWSFDLHQDAIYRSLGPGRRVNHFPGIGAVHFKDEFARSLADAGFDGVMPETFHVGRDFDEWRAAADRQPDTIWILKPTDLTGGRGTRILVHPQELERSAHASGWIVQRYVADPLLLPGEPFKHSMRVYVTVTSLDPLVAFLHENGPVKFTSREFGTDPHELADPVRHLTNPSIQMTNTEQRDPVRAIDWIAYSRMLEAAGIDAGALRDRIRAAVGKAILAARGPVLRASRHRCDSVGSCFELLGYDVTVDASLRPWLLECNASPSLGLRGEEGSASRQAQRRSKAPMLGELLTLLGVNRAGEPARAGWTPGREEAHGGWEPIEAASTAGQSLTAEAAWSDRSDR